MKTLKTTDPLKLTYGNSSDGRIFKKWRIYNREGAKLRTLATLNSDAMSPEREHSLCRLFATAPELLDTLQAVSEADFFEAMPSSVVEMVRAAITKATGN